MSIHGMRGQRRILLTIAAAALTVSACSAPRGQADGTPFELDQVSEERAELTTRVKAALVADERVIAASINVVLVEGEQATEPEETSGNEGEIGTDSDENESEDSSDARGIRLEGFVGDETEREAALEVARTASEGLDVIDALEIR